MLGIPIEWITHGAAVLCGLGLGVAGTLLFEWWTIVNGLPMYGPPEDYPSPPDEKR